MLTLTFTSTADQQQFPWQEARALVNQRADQDASHAAQFSKLETLLASFSERLDTMSAEIARLSTKATAESVVTTITPPKERKRRASAPRGYNPATAICGPHLPTDDEVRAFSAKWWAERNKQVTAGWVLEQIAVNKWRTVSYAKLRRVFRVQDWRYDEVLGELVKGGVLVELPPHGGRASREWAVVRAC